MQIRSFLVCTFAARCDQFNGLRRNFDYRFFIQKFGQSEFVVPACLGESTYVINGSGSPSFPVILCSVVENI
ncbi:unnamed protein product [Calypogeia fissa]